MNKTVTIRLFGTEITVLQSWVEWTKHLAHKCTRRWSNGYGWVYAEFSITGPHPFDCQCHKCNAWQEEKRLHDQYRIDAGLPV